MRRKLRLLAAGLGAGPVDVIATYAFTEAKMAWVECPAPPGGEPGGYHIGADLAIIEIIDPETGRTVGPMQPGEIVFSALDSRGTVVLRYRTGDDDSGEDRNAYIRRRLHAGRTYVLRLRLYYAADSGETAVMWW